MRDETFISSRKKTIIDKALHRGETSLKEIAQANNIGLSTLDRWIRYYKTIIGGKLRSKDTYNQNTEIQIGVLILNHCERLVYPKSDVLHRILAKVGEVCLHFFCATTPISPSIRFNIIFD